jgi:aspartate carbamoyltransferase catalytic subunit
MQSPEIFPALDDETSLQLNAKGELRHLLTLKGLSRDMLTEMLDEAQHFVSTPGGLAIRSRSLLGRTVANLFF